MSRISSAPHRESGCYSCEQEGVAELPPRERVGPSVHWRVAHTFDTALPGWLVVLPRRHVTAMAELDEAEAAELGPLLVDLGRALGEVTGCVKTYVMQYAEAEGFGHVHLHVVPRAADLAPELRGPGIFGLLGVPEAERISEAERDRLAGELTAALAR
ncbi:MAG: HIT domain-containing protein [Lapillicoccus sp.]